MATLTRRQAIGVLAATPTKAPLSPRRVLAAGDRSPARGFLAGRISTGTCRWSELGSALGPRCGEEWSAVFTGCVRRQEASPAELDARRTGLTRSDQVDRFRYGRGTPENGGEFRLAAEGAPAASRDTGPSCSRGDVDAIDIDCGRLKCRVGRRGAALIESMKVDGREVASNGRLACSLEDRSQLESSQTIRYQRFASEIKKVTVEQSGPVRATVKIEGRSQSEEGRASGCRLWCGSTSTGARRAVRLIHTIVFDGDQERDFISGAGVRRRSANARAGTQSSRAIQR